MSFFSTTLKTKIIEIADQINHETNVLERLLIYTIYLFLLHIQYSGIYIPLLDDAGKYIILSI